MNTYKLLGPVEVVETRKVIAVAQICNARISHGHTKPGDEEKPTFLALSPFGETPVLDCGASHLLVGSTSASVAIALQNLGAKLLSGSPVQTAAVVGVAEQARQQIAEDLEGYLAYLEVFLTNKSFLVEDKFSLADVLVGVHIKTLQNGGLELSPAVERWIKSVFAIEVRVQRAFKVSAASPASRNKKIFDKPAGEKSSPATAPMAKDMLPKKMEVEVEALPPTEFRIDEWKRNYSNSKDLPVTMQEFFKTVDTSGYCLWKVSYEKMEGECEKDFQASNLLGGFIQAMPNEARKYGFGVFDVVGTAPDLNYEGVLLMRGNDMPKFMFEHRSFEYHFWTRLDISVEEDREYIERVWCAEAGDMIGDKIIRDAKQFK